MLSLWPQWGMSFDVIEGAWYRFEGSLAVLNIILRGREGGWWKDVWKITGFGRVGGGAGGVC